MGARAGISLDEYLHASFPHLDREYRDGELVERSVPDYLHGWTQALLLVFFEALRKKLSFYACSETRVKVREGLYLIPSRGACHTFGWWTSLATHVHLRSGRFHRSVFVANTGTGRGSYAGSDLRVGKQLCKG
jgi:hypothetical protein